MCTYIRSVLNGWVRSERPIVAVGFLEVQHQGLPLGQPLLVVVRVGVPGLSDFRFVGIDDSEGANRPIHDYVGRNPSLVLPTLSRTVI